MKKLAVSCWLLAIGVAMAAGARAGTIDVTQSNFAQNRTLQNVNTYRIVEDVTFTAPAVESALQVANGATVTLVVPAGVTVTLKGGDANGTTGAGAGIEVPENATLCILGEGTLNATGGNAATGADGAAGGNGKRDGGTGTITVWVAPGGGGNGGTGGGGAGAGIGGRGGNGGLGGTGGAGVTELAARKAYAGNAGGKGGDGTRGGNCGTVIVAETVRFGVGGGSAPDTAGSGGGFGYIYVKQWLWWYYAWGGLFLLTAGLGFASAEGGISRACCLIASLLFFVPPVMLLLCGDAHDRKIIFRLAALSLSLTLVTLIISVISAREVN